VSGAQAAIIPTLTGTTSSGGNTVFDYTVNLTADENINAGTSAFLTLYDLPTQVATPSEIATSGPVAYTIQNVGTGHPEALTAPAVDSATLPNITFNYTGPPVLGPTNDLFSFTLTAPYNAGTAPSIFFNSQADKASNGALDGFISSVAGPAPPPPPGVPEPGAVALLCSSGIGGSLLLLRRRR
jgi:hypothetical protein